MRKILLSLVAGAVAVGGLAMTPASAEAGHPYRAHHARHVRVHRGYHWYHCWYRAPRPGC